MSARTRTTSGLIARQRQILDEARQEGGFIHVTALAQRLNVSLMTIRRDLIALERAGEVQRTRGGVLVRGSPFALREPPFRQRQNVNPAAKRSIARAAAGLVKPQQSIGVDVGTTTLELCPFLGEISPLFVITSSLPVASALAGTTEVHVPGGRVRPNELSLVGSAAAEGIGRFHLDTVFIGVAALDDRGAYDYSFDDTEIKKVMIERAERVVVLCDASKFGRRSTVTVCDLTTVSVLVTSAPPGTALAGALEAAGVEVIVAT